MNECQFKSNRQIGQRLKLARINANLSVIQLCDALGGECCCEQLEGYESGRLQIPAGNLAQIARKLQMPVDFFVDDSPLLDLSANWQLLSAYRVIEEKSQRRILKLVLDIATDVAVSEE